MNGPARVATRYPLTCYFVLALGLTGGWMAIAVGWLRLPTSAALPVGPFIGPAAAAVGLTALIDGRPGLRELLDRLLRWRVGLSWYALVLLGWPALFLLAALAGPGGSGAFRLPGPGAGLQTLGIVLVVLVLGGPLGEEPGWRGFALPRLQRRLAPLPATLLLGALHALWHLPVYLLLPGYNGAPPDPTGTLLAFGQFAVEVTAGAVLVTWVFNRTGASLVPVILLHASGNTAGAVVQQLFPGVPLPGEAVRFPAQLVIAAVLVLLTRGRLGHQPEPARAPAR
jgi:membrane protease YdiL (CAAX protease family)